MLNIFKEIFKQLRFMRSLKIRIFLIILLVGIIPSVFMRYGILQSYEERAVYQRQTVVQNQLKILANHLITYNYLQDTSSEVINAELAMLSSLYDGRVLVIGSNFRIVKDTYGLSEGRTIISEEVFRTFKGETLVNYVKPDEYTKEGYIEMTVPIIESTVDDSELGPDGKPLETTTVKGVLLTSISAEFITSTMDSLSRKAFILEALMIIIIFVIAAVCAVALAKPFDYVTDSINEVREGYADEALSVPDYVETTHIIDAFNSIHKRMKALDDSRQEFVANVSHELKTPLTSMKVLADSLLMQSDVPPELYREFLTDIAEEIDRENQIITDLLSLVKMDKTVAELNVSVVDINALTETILKRLRPIARKRDVEVIFESIRPVTAEVDEVKMALIISNLVENAIKYNKKQGSVKVVLDADHQFCLLEVSDTGLGIPEESMEHIFERFYRVDKSHSRELGGTGLGLAITRNAVLMHRGSIKLSSVEGEGTVFTVKIPLKCI